MTTLKPHLVRADTIDLQDQNNPSAQDHSRQPQHPSPFGYGPAAPHQAQTLRRTEEESYRLQQTSPRTSQENGAPFSDNQRYYEEDDEVEDEHMNHLHGPNGSADHDRDYDDGDASDSHDEDMDDDMMDKISSSPSIEDEDIDFEFVYALHTFVATVEGQANATKGDTMVLLDDSNSYWWLVRVVKDGSIGYLPAEHIETPTERLARLNKHRNIDLSASMLGDNTEKSKNPLKKAMRRRNAKTVQFAPPTYYEPSEAEYSDEDDGDDGQMDFDSDARTETADEAKQQGDDASTGSQATTAVNGVQRTASNESLTEPEPSSPVKAQSADPAQAALGHQDSVSRSRKGVVRNTDSFFKDDSVETKKISLTPRLLRGDSDSTGSADQEVRQRSSLDNFDKMVGVEEKPAKEEKKKEKKGMLSGLFKRKDKTPKGVKSDENVSKVSEESLRPSTHSKDSLDSVTKADAAVERRPSKLQKHPPTGVTSPKASPTESRPPQSQSQSSLTPAPLSIPAPTGPAPAPPTVRQVQSESSQESLQPPAEQQSQQNTPSRFPSLQEKRQLDQTGDAPLKPVYAKRAKERFALDASDSEDEQTPLGGATTGQGRASVSPLNEVQQTQNNHRRNDSGMQISPIEPPDDLESSFTAATKVISHETPEEVTPIEAENTASTSKASPSTATTHTPSTSRSTPTWSDASLRTYMENDQDIKDLLIIVHDKSNVMPVAHDHPLMANLFSDERSKLAEMQTQLDSMLMSWISRKSASALLR